jgi:uncharacterized membrane protein SpoIIM required for sporulation
MYTGPPYQDQPFWQGGIFDPDRAAMAGFYIQHNTTIGLRCFVMGLMLGVGGLFETVFNALYLGAIFGYMGTTSEAVQNNFFEFTTAHGPFELNAIVLSAAAGMRVGFSIISTSGMTRRASLVKAGREALPIMSAAVLLFFGAAFIEAFISPSALPYAAKVVVAAVSTFALLWYFVVLGTRDNDDTTDPVAAQPLAASRARSPFDPPMVGPTENL